MPRALSAVFRKEVHHVFLFWMPCHAAALLLLLLFSRSIFHPNSEIDPFLNNFLQDNILTKVCTKRQEKEKTAHHNYGSNCGYAQNPMALKMILIFQSCKEQVVSKTINTRCFGVII